MLFSDVERYPRTTPLVSTTAVAALAFLREQTFPQLIHPPQFIPRSRSLPARPEWVSRLLQHFRRQVVIAGAFAAAVLILAAALPAWAALQQDGSAAAAPRTARSSIGTTGTAGTRVEDLGAATFLGRIPFVQQVRYLTALTGGSPEARRFVDGARQATLAQYLQGVGVRAALPYLSDIVSTKEAIDTWTAALEEAERQRTLQAAASPGRAVWRAPSLTSGSRIPGATVTFYACIDDGFCGNMASGQPVFAGAAACSADLPFGTRFVIVNDPSGRVFVCLDRGALASPWVDIWFYDAADGWAWQSIVGTRSDIVIVE